VARFYSNNEILKNRILYILFEFFKVYDIGFTRIKIFFRVPDFIERERNYKKIGKAKYFSYLWVLRRIGCKKKKGFFMGKNIFGQRIK
jgi:hypothetical protein